MNKRPKVRMIGVCSAIPYAVRCAETDELLGYADQHFGPITLSKEMSRLRECIEVEVVSVVELD